MMGQLRAKAIPASAAALALWLVLLPVAGAAPAHQRSFARGTVVALQGTPHLWIADAQGVLHWAGDTRALAGRYINWRDRRDVTLAQLQDLSRGDPWLSAGLLQDGALIYLAKWENADPKPRLLHIQSIADVELFGINRRNYGALVYDPPAWERHFGIAVTGLERAELPLVTGPTLAWGEPGDKPGQFRQPAGVAVDAEGNVYVADFGNDRVQKFSPRGQPLAQWGTTGSQPGQFQGPKSVAVDRQRNLYVADYWNHRIQKLSPTGQLLAQWGAYGSAPGQFDHPAGIAVDTAGNLYIADYWNHRIQKLSPTGQPLAQWGTRGSNPGQFLWPAGIAVDTQGNLYVADTGNRRIQQLSPAGIPLTHWAVEQPTAVAVDVQGNVYVTNERRIRKFSPEGRLLGQRTTQDDDGAGRFFQLAGIGVDAQGTIYVTDRGAGHIVRVPATALE